MNSLSMNIREFKANLIDMNLVAIKKIKSKPIEVNYKDIEEKNLILEYNYYVKLIKRIKNCIISNQCKKIMLKTLEDKSHKIICIAIIMEKSKIDIGLSIDINIITGNECSTFLDCTYYDTNKDGILYINNFKSSKPKQGHGGLILANLDEIIYSINENLNKLKYQEIKIIRGIMNPDRNIIKEEELRKFYQKYNFNMYPNNIIERYIKTF